jgi:hypothetical protein
MGAFALRRFGRRLFSPSAGILGVAFLAFAITFPTVGEARLSAHHSEVGTECSPRLPGRVWIRGAGKCKEQLAAPTLLPQRVAISGKVGVALADLYCRTASIDVTQFTRKAAAALPLPSPPQRPIDLSGNVALEWPSGGFDPNPDSGMIEALRVARLPDG